MDREVKTTLSYSVVTRAGKFMSTDSRQPRGMPNTIDGFPGVSTNSGAATDISGKEFRNETMLHAGISVHT
jgi:hypothetical protein